MTLIGHWYHHVRHEVTYSKISTLLEKIHDLKVILVKEPRGISFPVADRPSDRLWHCLIEHIQAPIGELTWLLLDSVPTQNSDQFPAAPGGHESGVKWILKPGRPFDCYCVIGGLMANAGTSTSRLILTRSQ
jgi:hypothetical protein